MPSGRITIEQVGETWVADVETSGRPGDARRALIVRAASVDGVFDAAKAAFGALSAPSTFGALSAPGAAPGTAAA